MLRFIQAVVLAVLRLRASTVQTFWDFLEEVTKAAGKSAVAILSIPQRLLGGGPAAAAPIPNLEMALPDADRLTQAKDLEIGKAKVADVIIKRSPEMQVKIFAGMSEDERLNADLTLLSPAQVDWLMDLSDEQLKAVGETSDRRVAAALAGEPNAITAIRSVNQPDPGTETALAARIAAFRAGALTPASIRYAVN